MFIPLKRIHIIVLIIATGLTGCFGLFDSGGDHITGKYHTGWIDVQSSRNISKRDNDGIELEVIRGYIFQVGHNDRFIVAKQHPIEGESPNQHVNVKETTYYVIDLKLEPGQGDKGLYGPLDASQLVTLSNQLGIGKIPYDLNYPDNP